MSEQEQLPGIPMHKIALELRNEEREADHEYNRLREKEHNLEIGKKLPKKDREELDKLEKKYDFDNYYRNILRYAENLFSFGKDTIKQPNDDYLIPENEVWLVKTLLREYMSPFLKKMRTKRLTQVSFDDFNQLIGKVEQAIQKSVAEKDRAAELALLDFYTGFSRRQRLYQIKKEVEATIGEDWETLNRLLNVQLRMQLLDQYRKAMQDFSQQWRVSINRLVEVEEAVVDDMTEDDVGGNDRVRLSLFEPEEEQAIGEFMEVDLADVEIPYDDLARIDLKKFASASAHRRIDEKWHKWEKIIKAQDE
ncbi:hypothetical protein ACTID9_26415 [Brevibacillus fluminis]|uniref:hypothetical protein n=1 Tax=Brevibacillus fluminis TaxID=511487 RepID=UPI003F8BBB2E